MGENSFNDPEMGEKNNKPLVSVCIPVYNGADFIEFAINSVLEQDFSDYEVIIVDNKSTDNTLDIVRRYNDSRIVIFQNDSNIGMVPNWNRCIAYASGEYIKLLPADDFLYPGCLRSETDVLTKDKQKKISLVTARKNIINSRGKVLFSRGYAKREVQVDGCAAINRIIRKGGGNLIGEAGVVMFRKEILLKTGPFNSELFYVLDIDLWFKMLTHGDLYVLPGVLGSFRISESSASITVVDTQKRDIVAFMGKIYGNKEFGLKRMNYKLGLLNVNILTFVKKILYKIIL